MAAPAPAAARQLSISAHDPNSFANNRAARISHSSLQLTVDFGASVLVGHVDHTVQLLTDATELILDTAGGLAVQSVHAVAKDGAVQEGSLKFETCNADATFGTPVAITLPADARTAGSSCVIRVAYSTSPAAGAIQWLPPAQTKGGKYGYLFTQCQAIHCRSLMPCQDTPSSKFTYDAKIVVDAPLVAVMSALHKGSVAKDASHTEFAFAQPEPIPSYLLALAVGALEKRQIGPRSHVWSEREMVDAGAFEFADTEKFIAAGEAICGPYSWGIYDILLLPPSFPYGGMENPCLTFVTPTLLAGDRSLATVVAHEIAHSWFGNFVTSETWESFWMNEGFTVFLERKIVKSLKGKPAQDLHAAIGLTELRKSVDRFGTDHPYTCLHVHLQGVDPDDAFSSVPYEKGFNFLTYLESLVGEATMNRYLRAHCEKFAHNTVNSTQFKTFFLEFMRDATKGHIPAATLDQIDWESWLHKPGMPPVANQFDRSLIEGAEQLAATLLLDETAAAGAGASAGGVKGDALAGFESPQVVIMLEAVLEAQKKVLASGDAEARASFLDRLVHMDRLFGFTSSKNSEIRLRWLTLVLHQGMEDRYEAVETFLTEQGRMKFLRPLYRDFFAAAPERAQKLFAAQRARYHAIAAKMVARDLKME